ncbi:hypothetical protein NW752_008329 [Fusarium irregulare]|uniref:PD-(D/E)XK nuclease-like domain-containing protein n=1 Tax=Fusarium irregulare TaxID=2494466 RepID=A0A9W8PVR2_9HYPO|nr:hypothetical protein NW752_008329 [Fusarium irregulare]KAJ4019431.1 hypothetical protein NW766_003152 [Fusarium irregulare]
MCSLSSTTSGSQQPGTNLPRTTPRDDARPTMKRKRADIDAPDQTSHPASRRSEPDTMKDGPSDSASSGPDMNKPWLIHKTLNLSDKDMPASLKAFYKRLLPLLRDKNIMPCSCMETSEWESKAIFQTLDNDAYYDQPSHGSEYAKQLLASVHDIVVKADKCHSMQCDKTGWNNLVYTRIINCAIKSVGTEMGDWRLDFLPCERAVVDRRYQEDLAIKPRVDYVFFMVPNSDEGHELLDIQTNHFDPTNFMTFQPTRKYPIMFSIKSKELHGEDPISPEHRLAA